jgi:hypothetical protein
MRKRVYISGFILLTLGAGGWLEYRHLRANLFTPPAVMTPVSADQQVIHFTFDGTPSADGIPAPWQSRVIKGNLQVDLIDGPDPLGAKALRVVCRKSHFVLWDAASPYKADDYPVLSWQWKVAALPTNADVRLHSPIRLMGENRNDAAVQLLVGFEGNEVLSYIWDSTAPVGTEVQEPSPVAVVQTQVLDSGPSRLNQWIKHKVNIYKDYRRRFNKAPGKVLGISIQTNSNHTESTGDGAVADIVAEKSKEPLPATTGASEGGK